MLINWFTVLAQIINFLILVFLLKRFLYKPILRAMAEREKKMADALNRARESEKRALERFNELEAEKHALVSAREALKDKARAEIELWREGMLETIRTEMETLRKNWTENVIRERRSFLDSAKKMVAEQVMAVGEKVLRDLADEGVNKQVVRVFLEKLAEKETGFFTTKMDRPTVIQSGVPLEEMERERIKEGLDKWMPGAAGIQFQVEPGLGMGIQVVTGDRKVGWNLSDYLQDMEKEILENLFTDPRVKP